MKRASSRVPRGRARASHRHEAAAGRSDSQTGGKAPLTTVRRLLTAVAILMALIAVVLAVAWHRTAPATLPPASESAARLAPGPHPVATVELDWLDPSRPTAANGDYPGSPVRSFKVALWYPRDAPGEHPLAVYVHGFISSRHGGTYLAEHLASHGYVVVAADHPLTQMRAPGGPSAPDVIHQPADVSFLIDRMLALEGADRPFQGTIDDERIGIFGLSLGGITTTLVAFHPEWRDPRVAAAISIAGAGDVFGPRFFDHATLPFLMIAGTADSIVDYEHNALPIPDRIHDGGLASIAGGTHVGFTQVAAGAMRLLGSPDAAVCRLAGADLEVPLKNPFNGLLGAPEQGLLDIAEYPQPCARTFEHTISAGRQQMLTALLVRAFFESHFARDPDVRADHAKFLTLTLPAELPEVSYTPSRREPSNRTDAERPGASLAFRLANSWLRATSVLSRIDPRRRG
jgi:predicted dienelactone hydrolase